MGPYRSVGEGASMNGAYRKFLEKVAETFDDRETAERFIEHVESVSKAVGSPLEPDVVSYGDAQGQYLVDYIDSGWVCGLGYDPVKIGADNLPDILSSTAYDIYERMEEVDLGYTEALEHQIERHGLDLEEVALDEGGRSAPELASQKEAAARALGDATPSDGAPDAHEAL